MKKINFGIVLIILALIVTTMLAISEEGTKNKEKAGANAVFQEYIKVYNKYYMLKEEDRDINKAPNKEEYDKYLAEIKQELSKLVYKDNLEEIYQKYKENLDKQYQGQFMHKEYEIKLRDNLQYNLNDKNISILYQGELNINRDARINYSDINKKTNRYEGKTRNVNFVFGSAGIISFKKVDGEYKITNFTFNQIDLSYDQSINTLGNVFI